MVFNEIYGEEKEINIKTKNPEFLDWKWIELIKLQMLLLILNYTFTKNLKKKLKKLLIKRS